MKQIVVIYDGAADGLGRITKWIKQLISTEGSTSFHDEMITRWLVTEKDFTEISSSKTEDSAAKESSLESPGKLQQDPKFEKEETSSLSSRLHEIANSLPYTGCVVSLFIFLQSDDLQSNESFIPLAGAMKRFVEWHNTRATIIRLGSELSSYGQRLLQFVRCSSRNLNDEPQIDWPPWNGKVCVMDRIKNQGHVFPHFTLNCDNWNSFLKQKTPDIPISKPIKRNRRNMEPAKPKQRITVCGRQIEVLQEVDLRTFPVFMLTPWTLEMQTSHEDSITLKSYVQGRQVTGLLARLRMYYNLESIPRCADTRSFSTSAWKEYITSSPQRVKEPEEEQISACVQFIHLLILPNVFSHTTSSNPPLLAKVLYSPSEISPSIFCCLDQKMCSERSNERDVAEKKEDLKENDSLITSLPIIKLEKFHHLMQLFHEHQARAVKDWEDGHLDFSKEQFMQMMTTFEQHALDCMIERCKSLENCNEEKKAQETDGKQLKWISESRRPFCECPERLALQVPTDSLKLTRDSLGCENFSSSTPLSARKQRERSTTKDFHIEDILASFQSDGTANQAKKTPLKLKSNMERRGFAELYKLCNKGSDINSSDDEDDYIVHNNEFTHASDDDSTLRERGNSICRIPSHPDLSMKWPENQFVKYHDIYYYNTKEDLECENKFVDLRDKGNFLDTQSSFVTPKKKQPPRPLSKLSPVRSSPRATGPRPVLSRAHSQSLSRLSPMKKFKMASGLFKQPSSSQVIRKSPRKRLASSLTPNSDPPPLKMAHTHQIASLGSLSDLGTPVRRSPRKPSTMTQVATNCDNPAMKRLALTPASDKLVRRSPRKMPSFGSSSFGSSSASRPLSFELNSSQKSFGSSQKESSIQEAPPKETKAHKMKRSDRHKMRLQNIITTVLKEKGVEKGDGIYSACFRNLFNVSLVLLKALPNSQNLTEEMKSVVYTQAQNIINLEKRRSGIAI